MASRRAGKFQESLKRASRAEVDLVAANHAAKLHVVADHAPADDTARRVVVFDASAEEAAAMRAGASSDVLIEPQILHYPTRIAPMNFRNLKPGRASTVAAGVGASLSLKILGGPGVLEGAKVILFLRGPLGTQRVLERRTGKDGLASFEFASHFIVSAGIVEPAGNHWSIIFRGPLTGTHQIQCPLLPMETFGWWHQSVLAEPGSDRGKGVKVGVIDTGCGAHGALNHVVDIGAFIDGNRLPGGSADVDSHGTHVCGTIGARPAPGFYEGIAPAAELAISRVFPDETSGADQGDIVLAIDALSKEFGADLINMSLGAATGSEIERDAIIDALERGTLCVCAAGNEAGDVGFPAAFPEAVAISALGREGWAPPEAVSATRLPIEPERFGSESLYLANFSNSGPAVDAAAPGVGIIAPIPSRFGLVDPYGAMDGTSMASPVACGALAAALSADPVYATLPRDNTRSAYARKKLVQICRDIELAPDLQGRGVPRA
jgi:subtilisin